MWRCGPVCGLSFSLWRSSPQAQLITYSSIYADRRVLSLPCAPLRLSLTHLALAAVPGRLPRFCEHNGVISGYSDILSRNLGAEALAGCPWQRSNRGRCSFGAEPLDQLFGGIECGEEYNPNRRETRALDALHADWLGHRRERSRHDGKPNSFA